MGQEWRLYDVGGTRSSVSPESLKLLILLTSSPPERSMVSIL